MLKTFNIKCDGANNGQKAIQMVQDKYVDQGCDMCMGGYHLVFMDCNMPIMDGFQTTRRLKTLMNQGNIKNFPIVALSALAMKEDVKRAHRSGMDAYLTKPIAKQELGATIN